MKIALIARADNSGLGTLSREFAEHLKPHKVLIVENGQFHVFPERYEAFETRRVASTDTITPNLANWLLEGTDVLLSIETFYSSDIVTLAREKGVKTALVTMFEMQSWPMPIKPDLFICPSTLDYQVMPNPKVYLPIPFNTDRLVWKQRTTANTFIHTASHGGMNGRKGTALLIEATRYLKSDVKIIINTWQGFFVTDSRIEVRLVNYKNYWQCWQEGDVVIHPQDYNGICLPISEAFCSGMALITTNIKPFNEWVPKECLFEPSGFYKTRAAAGLIEVDAAKIDPKVLAAKIDAMAGQDITAISLKGKKYAEENSWTVLLPQYLKVLTELCNK